VGVSIWVRLRREIPGVDPLDCDGKLLARAIDVLDDASRGLRVRPLSDFFSVSRKQAIAELGPEADDMSDEEWAALADDHVWWPASEGLASVDALLKWVEQNPGNVNRAADVLVDLRRIRAALVAAVREGIEFNIAVSA
jgi:hypothetical protein